MTPRHPLQDIKSFPSLVKYLRDELEWPIEQESFDDLTFDFSPEELGLKPDEAAKIREIKQLRPLVTNQPWGIFFVKFEPRKLPVVALRKILGSLIIKKRASANKADRAAWQLHDLLFVSAFGDDQDRQITLAHFSEGTTGDLPTLKVLGWDELDTGLNLQHIDTRLHAFLRWPDDSQNTEAWRKQWADAFQLRHRQVITTAQELAEQLALLARKIRQKVLQVLSIESENGTLQKLYAAFRESLIHDLSEDDFADMYAQTITYGLFSAAVSRTTPDGGTIVLPDNLADMVPVTNPFLREMLSTFLTVGGRKGKLDFDELGIQEVIEVLNSPDTNLTAVVRNFGDRRQGEDPVIHFYEDFLKQYDKSRKVKRGVFYTPQPVVSFIVRSVHEQLQTDFGIEDGLASTITWEEMLQRHEGLTLPKGVDPKDHFVVILDPATGTATFLVEVIDVIYQTMTAKWNHERLSESQQRGAWNNYVAQNLLNRIYGYELMMAPYAIAHMKIGLKLAETGYRFESNARANVYLTNSLEPASDLAQTAAANLFEALGNEAQAVNAVKKNTRFTIVIGNPPYSYMSANLSSSAKEWAKPFRSINGAVIKERGALVLERALQEDYVKFFSFAIQNIRESGAGVLCMITNSSYQRSKQLRGMRHYITKVFSSYSILDLCGDTKDKLGDDQNVFDIAKGVAIGFGVLGVSPAEFTCSRKALVGTREHKFSVLRSTSIRNTEDLGRFSPEPDMFLFDAAVNQNSRNPEYRTWPRINDVYSLTSVGIKTNRDHLVIGNTDRDVIEKINVFINSALSVEDVKSQLGLNDNAQWTVEEGRRRCRATFDKSFCRGLAYRPFDVRRIYYHPSVVFNPRPAVMSQFEAVDNVALLTTRQIRTGEFAHCFVSSMICMAEMLSSADNCNVFPLWSFRHTLRGWRKETNISEKYMCSFESHVDSGGEANGNKSVKISAEMVFQYHYAILHSPQFRARYSHQLQVDFPRIPNPGSREVFVQLSQKGDALVDLHTNLAPVSRTSGVCFVGKPKAIVGTPCWHKESVYLDKKDLMQRGKKASETSFFSGVSHEVWEFRIGSYQVCDKWLKDRKGQSLSEADVQHYKRIVTTLAETIRIMKEIDEIIDKYGGWPGAFSTEPPLSSESSPGKTLFQ